MEILAPPLLELFRAQERDRGYPTPFSMSALVHCLPEEVRSKMLACKLTSRGGLIDWDAKHTTKRAIASGALDFTLQ